MKRLFFLAIVLGFLGGAAAWAGPLTPALIGAEAVWFGQVDLEEIWALPLAKSCPVLTGQDARWDKKMAKLQAKIGCNPMQDLLDVTFYATQYEGDYGVVLVRVRNLDRARLLAWFKERRPEHKTEPFGDLTLYSFTVRHRRKELELTGTIAADDLVVIGADGKHVRAALEVIQGKKPGLKEDSPLLRGWEKGTLWMSQAIAVPAEYRQTTKCPVLRQATTAFARWWTTGDLLQGRYNITAISKETADLLVQAVNGLKALYLLRFAGSAPLVKLAEGLSYKAEDAFFTLSWRGSSADLLAAGKAVHGMCGDGKKHGKETP